MLLNFFDRQIHVVEDLSAHLEVPAVNSEYLTEYRVPFHFFLKVYTFLSVNFK